jgi:hypothetical protein
MPKYKVSQIIEFCWEVEADNEAQATELADKLEYEDGEAIQAHVFADNDIYKVEEV